MKTFSAKFAQLLKQDFYIPLLIFLAIALVYPFANLPPVYIKVPRYDFQLFPPALVSSLALCVTLLSYKRIINAFKEFPFPFYCIATFFIISSWHFLQNDRLSYSDLCYSLSWVTIPLVAFLYAREFMKYLPWYMLIFWLLNLAYNTIMLYEGTQLVGLPGNRNWNASLIAATTPFAIYYIIRLCKKLKLHEHIMHLLIISAVASSLLFLLKAESKGANLALVISAFLITFFSVQLHIKKIIIITLLALATLGATISIFNSDSITQKIAQTVSDDIRPAIWKSAFSIIKENPLTGIDRANFESMIHEKRGIDYFLNKHAAVRTNHPHNHFIYILSCYGFIVFSAWIFLLIYPVMYCLLKQNQETDIKFKLIFFSFLVMFIHSMFDLIFFEWPSNILGPVIAGLLWFKIWPYHTSKLADITIPIGYSLFIKGATILLLGYTFYQANLIRKSTSAISTGMFYENVYDDKLGKLYYFDKSIKIRPDAMANYKAGVASFSSLRNPDLALKYLDGLKQDTPYNNFAHNHGFTGLSFFIKNQPKRALPYLLKEVKMYPASINAWYNLGRLYQRLGEPKKAANAQKMVQTCLKAKGFAPQDLHQILTNPKYDLQPAQYFSPQKDSSKANMTPIQESPK